MTEEAIAQKREAIGRVNEKLDAAIAGLDEQLDKKLKKTRARLPEGLLDVCEAEGARPAEDHR